MILYNIRSTPNHEQFIINKFDDDLNLAGSYLVRFNSCTCPASTRPTCKHRKMLFRMRSHVDDGWFYCYETQLWHRPITEEALPAPEGVTVMDLADPEAVHNTIAEAVGEPTLVTRR